MCVKACKRSYGADLDLLLEQVDLVLLLYQLLLLLGNLRHKKDTFTPTHIMFGQR